MIEFVLFALLGITFGIISGLTPGIHVNTISLALVGFAGAVNPYYLVVTIIALAITHTFWDFVPSILLGAPEPETALSVLPGHDMLLKGRGYEAIYLTIIGGIGAMILLVFLFPLFLFAIPFLYGNIQGYIHIILVAIVISMIAIEKRKILALLVFALSGFLGLIMLNSYLLEPNFLFFPIFTGLFGLSTLILSLNKKTRIPEQEKTTAKIPRKLAFSGMIKGIFSGALVGTLPGIGGAEATILTQQITREKNQKEFLISIGAINTVVSLFSLMSLYTISKARSGAAVAVERILPEFGFNELLLLMGVALLATGIASLLLLKSMKRIISLMQRIDYPKLTIGIIIFLIVLTIILAGPLGLFVLFVSTSIGLLAPLFGVKRSNSMGVLIFPLILFYAGIII